MKNSLLYLVVLVLAFFIIPASSCHKEEPEPDLVPITTTGANTMGFYVDGVVCNKIGKYGGLSAYGVIGGLSAEMVLYVFGGGGEPKNSVTIYVPTNGCEINYPYSLNKSILFYHEAVFVDDAPLGGNMYFTDSLHNGTISLLRCDQNVISGTFEFNAIHKETGKVIYVTDGRFDIKR